MAEQRNAPDFEATPEPNHPLPLRQFSRRAFLVGAAGAAGAAYVRPRGLLSVKLPKKLTATLTDASGPIGGTSPIGVGGGPTPDIVISAERASDLVLLDFAFDGFGLQAGTPPSIVPLAADNLVVVQFPPQAIGEGVYPWEGDDLPVDPPPILSDLSGPSRLCFNLPTTESIPLPTMTVSDLLDWSAWSLVVPAVAQVHGPNLLPPTASTATIPTPTAPTAFETAIEFPYALFLAPTVYASGSALDGFSSGFASRATPLISPAGVVDLWSTSLVGARTSFILDGPTRAPYVPSVSAVWADDFYSPPIVSGPPPPVPNDTPESYIEYGYEVIQ